MKALLVLQLLTGLALAFAVPLFEQAEVVALWSDFMAFKGRVEKDEAGARVLSYGGESSTENFEHLVERLRQLRPSTLPRVAGLLITVTSAVMLMLLPRTRRSEQMLTLNLAADHFPKGTPQE